MFKKPQAAIKPISFGALLDLQKVRVSENLEIVWRCRFPPHKQHQHMVHQLNPAQLVVLILVRWVRYFKSGTKAEVAPVRPVCCLRSPLSLNAGQLVRLM